MYSILIPNYNDTNVRSLVRMITSCASREQAEYEIIVLDDASTNEALVPIYLELNNYPKVHCFKLPDNKGRTYTRNYLAKLARYNWLLFMDSDTIPQEYMFIKRYIRAMLLRDVEVIFGGVFYGFLPPNDKQRRLRFFFGSERESKSLSIRKNQVYLSVISTCFAIQKKLFLSLEVPKENRYGLDVFFSFQLQKRTVNIQHIESLVEVREIESTDVFLKKTKEAIETLHYLVSNQMIPKDYTPLLKVSNKLIKWKLANSYVFLATKLESIMLRNLHAERPSMRVFDFYRLMLYLKLASGLNSENFQD